MTNQIPINIHDFNDYFLTPSERITIFSMEKSGYYLLAWNDEMNYLTEKMILDFIFTIGTLETPSF